MGDGPRVPWTKPANHHTLRRVNMAKRVKRNSWQDKERKKVKQNHHGNMMRVNRRGGVDGMSSLDAAFLEIEHRRQGGK